MISRRKFLRATALTMGATLLAACGATPTPTPQPKPQPTPTPASAGTAPQATKPAATPVAVGTKPTTITWLGWGGPNKQDAVLKFWATAFPETSSWLTPQWISVGSGSGDAFQQLRVQMAAGGADLPDVFEGNSTSLPEFSERGLYTNLDDRMAPYASDLQPGATGVASYKGHFMGVPVSLTSKVYFYRTDLFQQAGVDLSKVKTLQDFVDAGKTIRQKFPNSYFMHWAPQVDYRVIGAGLSHFDDIRMADDTGKWNVVSNPHYGEVFDNMKTIMKSGISYPTGELTSDWGPAVKDEKIIGDLTYAWMPAFLPPVAVGQIGKWGIAPYPDFMRYGSNSGGGATGISKFSKNPDAGFTFLRQLFLDVTGTVGVWKIRGQPPATKSAQDALVKLVPTLTRPDGITDAAWEATPYNFFGPKFMDSMLGTLQYMKTFPFDPSNSAEFNILAQHLDAYISDKETLNAALAGAESDMKAQIGNPYKLS